MILSSMKSQEKTPGIQGDGKWIRIGEGDMIMTSFFDNNDKLFGVSIKRFASNMAKQEIAKV